MRIDANQDSQSKGRKQTGKEHEGQAKQTGPTKRFCGRIVVLLHSSSVQEGRQFCQLVFTVLQFGFETIYLRSHVIARIQV